jgi:hypothetical protein
MTMSLAGPGCTRVGPGVVSLVRSVVAAYVVMGLLTAGRAKVPADRTPARVT